MVRSTYKNRSYLNLLDGLPDCIPPDDIKDGESYTLMHHTILNNEWQLEYVDVGDILHLEEVHFKEVTVLEKNGIYLLMLLKNTNGIKKAASLDTYGGLWGLRYSGVKKGYRNRFFNR